MRDTARNRGGRSQAQAVALLFESFSSQIPGGGPLFSNHTPIVLSYFSVPLLQSFETVCLTNKRNGSLVFFLVFVLTF